MPYPVSVVVEPLLTNRNRLTTFFRLILAIPHLVLVGGIGFGLASHGDSKTTIGSESGLLGAAAIFLAVVSWFTILFSGKHIPGIRQFTTFYMGWRVRAIAYFMLLQDAYPPFGEGVYPTTVHIAEPTPARDRLSVALRIIFAIPHFIALFFVLFAWCLTTIAAWFAILFTRTYPEGLYRFGVGALTWRLRLEAYLLLMVDDYPPFSLTS